MGPERLNFHHLHYFWAVAKEGNLTRAAGQLRVSQSALSAQIRQLEDQLGEALFHREARRLVLTEAGRMVLGYAEDIFATGSELVANLKSGRRREELLRIGAVATLSRNFQELFVKPLLMRGGASHPPKLRLVAGAFDDLLDRLERHELDLVLANRPAPTPARRGKNDEPAKTSWRSRRVARQEVSIVGHQRRSRPFRFPEDLASAPPMIVPGRDSAIRTELDALCEQLGVQVRILAEVDDMAMLRLLARDTDAIAVVPSIVVRDELESKVLREHCVVPGLYETFYAITVDRRFQHPLVTSLLARDEAELLATRPAKSTTRRARSRTS